MAYFLLTLKLIRRTSPKPPSVAEIFSAILGVFGVSRRKSFCFFASRGALSAVKISLVIDYIGFSVKLKTEALAGSTRIKNSR